MSHSDYFKPLQKKANAYVGGARHIPESENFSNNQEYVREQIDIVQSQDQHSIGTIPDYINRSSQSDLIESLRYGIVTPNTSGSGLNTENSHRPQSVYHKFDPYFEFLHKKGAFKENSRPRIKSVYFTINSSARTTQPNVTLTNEINLDKNPLSFGTVDISVGISDSKQNILVIKYPNHTIKKNDRLTLTGLTKTSVSIKNIYVDANSVTQNAIVFTKDSKSVVFYCNFDTELTNGGTDTSMSFDPNFKVGNGLKFGDLQSYDTSDMFITISGFDISQTGTPFVGNIPINFLNSTHQIHFTNPDYKLINGIPSYTADTLINKPNNNGIVSKITGFYIKLPTAFTGFNSTNAMTIDLTFNYVGGVPINKINAQFPIDESSLKGYHKVYSVTPSTINILLDKDTHFKDPSGNGLTEIQTPFGGSEIFIALVSDLENGYSNSNNYRVELPYSVSDVVQVRMLSMSFPNTSKVFTNTTGIKNTRLYWQNQDDGDFIYNIELDPGNYSPSQLEKIISDKFYQVKRKYSKIANTSTSYTDRNFMTVSIDTNTNKVTISGFKEASLIKPIQDISPEIASVGDGNPPYTLTISQDAHGLLPGGSVVFTGFVSTSGIPTDILNSTHIVSSVPTPDTYTIILDNFNLLAGTRNATGGGYAAKAHVPSAFKLLFNYPDTMGTQLGFRKVGQDVAVSKFSTVITNYDEYENEATILGIDGIRYIFDESGNQVPLVSNSLKLSGYDYVVMVIRNFDNISIVSDNKIIKTFFAKINISGLPGRMLFDTFICPPLVFHEPQDISHLDISFYTPDGLLYDFNGVDHTFDLEFTAIDYVPDGTGIISTKAAF